MQTSIESDVLCNYHSAVVPSNHNSHNCGFHFLHWLRVRIQIILNNFSLTFLWNRICEETVVPINWPSSKNITSSICSCCLAASTFQISWAVSGHTECLRVRRTLLRISLDTGVSCGDRKFLLQKWLQCWSPAYIMLSNKIKNLFWVNWANLVWFLLLSLF